jgi:hypothetical protein
MMTDIYTSAFILFAVCITYGLMSIVTERYDEDE